MQCPGCRAEMRLVRSYIESSGERVCEYECRDKRCGKKAAKRKNGKAKRLDLESFIS